ncbi:MAG: SRPBCC family protein [Pseudomonadales bacterium]|jgi:hypothetical protein|nr:SRPBCC family protein [Pseudomonadales bacterium]MDP6469738.1 SRPBCC family protein [Pseudomonadales bacterium]MDP6827661.1 SRPBCC family protein [Pseudomonadales bacterium]MDP6971899.1 SRPBCC family protein [Pseudomonadales bacterium]|tara:strand:+ start:2214 stop:2627 length:414 start_codon:yes stop_codon:yes gene_type:complete
MTTVQVLEAVEANATDVWNILSDFGGIEVGGPIEAFEIEGEGVGAVRTITMGGAQIVERLEVLDNEAHVFTYAIINEDNPLPVANYSATVTVTPDGDSSCSVDWTGTFEAVGDEDAASELVRGIYTGGIQRARAALT